MNFNKVFLGGFMTRDPEVRYAPSGTAIVKFGLAVNRKFQDKEGNWTEEPTFVDVTMFGKRGEAFARFHGKGKPAFVEGELRLDQWEDKNGGGKRSKLYVVAFGWEFVGGGDGKGGGGGGAPAASSSRGGEGGWSQQDIDDQTPF